jgi:hypothetical protein
MKPHHKYNSPEQIEVELKALKSLNLLRESFPNISSLIENKLGSIPIRGTLLKKGTEFFRARKNPIFQQNKFSKLSEISLRDKSSVKAFGRANIPGQSVFYAALDRLTAAREVTQWQINEMGLLLRKGISLIDYHPFTQFMTISKWVSKVDLLIMTPYEIVSTPICAFEEALANLEKSYVIDRTKYIISEKLVLDFFNAEFCKTEIKGENDYFFSAYYSNLFYKSIGAKEKSGLMYLSIANDLDGKNIAIPSNNVDFIDFVEADFCYIYNANDRADLQGQKIVGMPISRATKQSDGSLNWVKIV